jgi:hypothetical protein
VVKNLIQILLLSRDNAERNRSGLAIPIPKRTKLTKFAMKSAVVVDIAKSRMIEPGLQGRATSPKNAPNRIAVI